MKQLKTVIALLLILLLTLSFAGCGSKDSSDSGDTPDEQSQDIDQNDDAQDDEDVDTDTDAETEDSDEIWDEEDLEDLDDDPEGEADVDEDTEDEDEDEDAEEEESYEAPAELTGDYTGAFVSNTETPLNLNVQWAADKASDGTYDVTLQFYLECYSIQVSERSGNKLKVKTSSETKEYSFNTKEVMREENTLEKVMIGETKIKLSEEELADGAKVEASWDFRGSYSGTDLPEVVAKGEIKGN